MNKAAEIHEAQNDLDTALEYYEEAFAIFQKLQEKYPENSVYLRDYAISMEKVKSLKVC